MKRKEKEKTDWKNELPKEKRGFESYRVGTRLVKKGDVETRRGTEQSMTLFAQALVARKKSKSLPKKSGKSKAKEKKIKHKMDQMMANE